MNNNMSETKVQYIDYRCELCGVDFSRPKQRGRTPRFCSTYCADKHRNTRYKKENSVKMRCKECGAFFMSNNPKQDFCSYSCSAKRRVNRLMEKECKKCGNSFKGKQAHDYCSEQCRIETRICEECGNEFDAYYYSQKKFCSVQCTGKSAVKKLCTCERCGTQFAGSKNRVNRYCSRECFFEQVGYVAKNTKQLSRLTDISSYKRAEKYGVERERIDVLRVFERDNWICGICNDKVNEKIPYPDAKSASLDHIIPLSKGGTHTYGNVQCSHFGCNTKKNNHLEVVEMV